MRNHDVQQVESQGEFEESVLVEEKEQSSDIEDTKIMVDIKGEITNPGVYEIDQNRRVIDVVKIAGGFTKLADEQQINLAQKVVDEMVIIVPKEGEEMIGHVTTAPLSDVDSNEPKVRINQATQEEIETLNGIGPSKAQAIIEYREENGPFQDVEDLLLVNGIGEKTLENIQDQIVIP